MKKNYHKKLSYDYQYNSTNTLRQEIEQIRRIQEQNQKKTKIKKINHFFNRIKNSKKNNDLHIYPETEFLGI